MATSGSRNICKLVGIEKFRTNGRPFMALSSKYGDGLKKLPYNSVHLLSFSYMLLDPTLSAQYMIPPLQIKPNC